MSIEDEMKKYGIESISTITELNLTPRVIIRYTNKTKYIYDVERTWSDDDIYILLKKHIHKYHIRDIRKEKLKKFNEI